MTTDKLFKQVLILTASAFLLQACGDDDDPMIPTPASYLVTLTNLTAAQPISPPLLVLHDGSYQLFEIGSTASAGFEIMAEGGDNSTLQNEADAASDVVSTVAGSAPIGPGASSEFIIDAAVSQQTVGLSLAGMLVNTNDAVTGVASIDISSLPINESMVLNAIAYDAGTEANSEASGTIPGPADGGEGFNAARDDITDQITVHSGVITSDDGLATSVLGDQHRFLNPVLRVEVERIE
jgi:hypothetical protein